MEQFCGCWITYPRCKEDCYWYEEWQDMSAHIPYCRCKGEDFINPKDCENCEQYHSKYKPTNADHIRRMTDEELAEWINKHDCHTNLYGYDPKEAVLDWLKQEVEE